MARSRVLNRRPCAPLLLAATIAAGAAMGDVSAAAVAAAPLAPPSPRSRNTVVMGSAWNADDSPIPGARLRLRNVVTGKIEAAAVANDAGQFTFAGLEGGTYAVELVTETGHILTVGHVFTIAPGETVATFVRLATRVPWFSGFFNNAATAAAAAAAGEGITALAPVVRPVSRNK